MERRIVIGGGSPGREERRPHFFKRGTRLTHRFGDRSFAVAGPRLWNSLPISLRQISGYGQFRRYLKNHLFGI